MEQLVIYRDNQELQAADFINQQDWAQQALDHVVLDAIDSGKAYSGFALSKASATVVQVGTGRLYSAGQVFARNDVVPLDLFNDLPVATKRYFAIVAWGTTVDEDIQPRNFLIDANTGMAEPQSVAMQKTRYCNINYVRGTEASDPQYPNVDATTLLLGFVLCDPTGILSVTQSTDNQLDNLAILSGRTTVLEAWRGILAGMVDTLRTDLANLARSLLLYTPLTDYQRLLNIVSNLADRVLRCEVSIATITNTFFWNGTDFFLDESQTSKTTLDSIAYSAQINEGLRFAGGSVDSSGKLNLLNPNEPLILTADNMVLPNPSGSRVRYDCSFQDFPWIEHRILATAVYNPSFVCHHLRPSRWRWRCGPHFLPSRDNTVWWQQGYRDPTNRILSFLSESWEIRNWDDTGDHDEDDVHWPRHGSDRWKYYWRDWVHLPYWDRVFTDYNHSGNHMAQSFFNSQDGWLTGITIFMTNTTWGPLNVVISGCDPTGRPDHDGHTLRRIILDGPTMQSCSQAAIYAGDIIAEEVVTVAAHHGDVVYETIFKKVPVFVTPVRIPIPPTFLRAGQYYAFNFDSTFDHKFCVTDRDDAFQVHQGHIWHSDGQKLVAWLTGPLSLRFLMHFATWSRWGDQASPGGQLRYEIGLQPLLLAGGIGSIDVLGESIIPEATALTYEIQVGGLWKSFAGDPDNPSFTGSPTQLQFRMVFQGTTDLMPAVSMANSQVTLTAAPLTTFHHYSTAITCASTSVIKVVLRLLNFVEATMDIVCSLHTGGSTHKTFDVDDLGQILADGSMVRTFTFNVTTVTTFQVELHGTVTSGIPFNVVERKVFCRTT